MDGLVSQVLETVGSSTVFVGRRFEVFPGFLRVEGACEVDTDGSDFLLSVLGHDGDGDGSEGKCESHVKLCGSLLL